MTTTNLSPAQCPRYESCAANVCPLDPEWQSRSHRYREAVCAYLTEAAKTGGEAVVRRELPKDAAEAVLIASPLIAAKHPDIAARLKRASGFGSRAARGHSLTACRIGGDVARNVA